MFFKHHLITSEKKKKIFIKNKFVIDVLFQIFYEYILIFQEYKLFPSSSPR
jgi:hypothetical protein